MQPKMAKAAKVARNESTAAQIRGGTLRFYAGVEPDDIDNAIGERPELVRVEIPDSKLAVRADSAGVLARGLAKAVVAAEGEPTFYRFCGREGNAVLQGPVVTGEAAARAFEKVHTFRGVAIDIPHLYRGMEFELPEIRVMLGGVGGMGAGA